MSVNKITYPGMDAAFVTQVMQDTREQLIVVAENQHACHDLTTVMVAKSRPSLGIRAKSHERCDIRESTKIAYLQRALSP